MIVMQCTTSFRPVFYLGILEKQEPHIKFFFFFFLYLLLFLSLVLLLVVVVVVVKICIDGWNSKRAKLPFGVLQGSILGPLLFLIFMYDFALMFDTALPSTFPTSLQKILLLQKKFLRLATSSNHFEPSAPLFRKLNCY